MGWKGWIVFTRPIKRKFLSNRPRIGFEFRRRFDVVDDDDDDDDGAPKVSPQGLRQYRPDFSLSSCTLSSSTPSHVRAREKTTSAAALKYARRRRARERGSHALLPRWISDCLPCPLFRGNVLIRIKADEKWSWISRLTEVGETTLITSVLSRPTAGQVL